MVIVDAGGSRVKLACVNWYGFQLEDLVLNGLDRQPLEKIALRISELGFNCVRLVYALDVIYKNPVIAEHRLSANPDLVGITSLELFDKTVEVLTETAGLMVILNNHVSSAGWCCSDSDGEGLWYTPEYPAEVFFSHWTLMSERYRNNSRVIGADLRNEVRGVPGGILGTIQATWGWGNNETDWNVAAEEAAIRVHEANPEMLIFVGGIVAGGFLTPAYFAPIKLPDQSKLVYTGHFYPFTPVLSDLSYDLLDPLLFVIQTFVEVPGHAYSAPFWMGEFGTGENSENWQKIFRFVKEHDLDWAYWPIDGYKNPGESEGFGILEDDFYTIRHDWKLQQLQEIIPILSK